MKRIRKPIATVLALVAVLTVLAIAALLAFEFWIPADGLRPRVATIAGALGCPVTIDGPLRLVTGIHPGIELHDVRMQECRQIRIARAGARRLRARVSLWSVISREIRLTEISGERLEAQLTAEAPVRPAGDAAERPRWSLTEIAHLRFAPVRVQISGATGIHPSFELDELEAWAGEAQPMRLAVRGTHRGQAWEAGIVTASLSEAFGGPPQWPLEIQTAFAGASAALRGSVMPSPLRLEAEVSLKSAAGHELVRALGARSPEIGAIELTGRLALTAGSARLDQMVLAGPMGSISGEVRLELAGGRPVLDARLGTQQLDYAVLRNWFSTGSETRSTEELLDKAFEGLRGFDVVITAAIARVAGAPIRTAGADASLRVAAGQARLNVAASVDGVPATVDLDIDARGPFAIEGRASVKALPRAALARSPDALRIDSRIGALSATLSARGATVRTLLESASAGLNGKDLRLTIPLAGDRRELWLRSVSLWSDRAQAARASAAGTLSGEPVEIDFAAGSLADLVANRTWTVKRLRGRLGAAQGEASGRVERPLRDRAVALDFTLEVSRLDRLAPLAGEAALPRMPASLRGAIVSDGAGWRVQAEAFAVGETRGKGHVAGKRGAPIEVALDLQQLAADGFAGPAESSRSPPERAKAPAFPDMDVSLKAVKARYQGQRFGAVTLQARLREGALRAPFSFDWAGARVEGQVDARLAADPIRIEGELGATGLDVGRLPGPLVKRDVKGRIERVAARFESAGASMEALARNVGITVELSDARLMLPKSGRFPQGARLEFDGSARAPTGAPIVFSVEGRFEDKPVTVSGELPPLAGASAADGLHAMRVAMEFAGVRLGAQGKASIDPDAPRFAGSLSLSGESAGALADLAGIPAAGIGPYELSGNVEADAARLTARDVELRLGRSELRGSLAIELDRPRARIAARLDGRPVHLEDLGAKVPGQGNWFDRLMTAMERGTRSDSPAGGPGARSPGAGMPALDVELELGLDPIVSAGETIGRASINARLEGGRLTVKPLTLSVGSGTIRAEIEYDGRQDASSYSIRSEASGVDYGMLGRALDPAKTLEGTFDASLRIVSGGGSPGPGDSATGTFDVLLLPRDHRAGKLDALDQGILRRITGALDSPPESTLNCVVGSFDIAGGAARSRIVLLDTTYARIAGGLELELRSGSLSGYLVPRSKQPDLFSVAPGLTIGGTLRKPEVSVAAREIVVGALRLWQFPVAFATDWLGTRNLSPDGTPDCRAAYRSVLH